MLPATRRARQSAFRITSQPGEQHRAEAKFVTPSSAAKVRSALSRVTRVEVALLGLFALAMLSLVLS